MTSSTSTITTWNLPLFRAPNRFRNPNKTANPMATGTAGSSGQKMPRYAPMPMSAKAVLKLRESQVPNPPMVPTSEPSSRTSILAL